MKKILIGLIILIISLILFKSLDEKLYKKNAPIFNSLKIYHKENTDDYYFVYEVNKNIGKNEINGARMFLHGKPIKNEVELLPDQRKQYGVDNWNFNLEIINKKYIVKVLKSQATTYESISMGLYRDSDGNAIKNKSMIILNDLKLEKAAVIDKFNLLDLPKTELNYLSKDLKNLTNYKKVYLSYASVLIVFLSLMILVNKIFEFIKTEVKPIYKSKKDIFSALSLVIVSIYPIFIFLKKGALSTVVDVLLGMLIIRFILKERIKDRSKVIIYVFLILTMVWWHYATLNGIAPNEGRQWYKGIMVKYMLLPILLSLTKVNWEKIKKIFWIYLLASVPYWMYFINNINKPRFGDGWATQHMAQLACGLALISLSYALTESMEKKRKFFFGMLFIFGSFMTLKSGARGVWIAYLPLATLIFFIRDWKKTLIVGVLIAGVGVSYMLKNPDDYFVNRITSIVEIKEDSSNKQRIDMWKLAPKIVKEDPIKGIGIKGFKKYTSEDEGVNEKFEAIKKNLEVEENNKVKDLEKISTLRKSYREASYVKRGPVHIHNTYLEVLISTGVIGFILFFTTLSLILKKIWNKFRESKYINEKIFLGSILLFNIMQMIYGLTEYTLSIEVVQQSIWFIMALALNYELKEDDR